MVSFCGRFKQALSLSLCVFVQVGQWLFSVPNANFLRPQDLAVRLEGEWVTFFLSAKSNRYLSLCVLMTFTAVIHFVFDVMISHPYRLQADRRPRALSTVSAKRFAFIRPESWFLGFSSSVQAADSEIPVSLVCLRPPLWRNISRNRDSSWTRERWVWLQSSWSDHLTPNLLWDRPQESYL